MPLPRYVPSLGQPLMRERVYDVLREWIVVGTLAPGERLRDSELAASLGVSRTPVREALRRLEDEGLVQASSNRWTKVAPLELTDAYEVYPIVERLECFALTLALPAITESDLGDLRTANKAVLLSLSRGDPLATLKAEDRFHDLIIERAGNSNIRRVLSDLKLRLRRFELGYFGGVPQALSLIDSHAVIVEALARRDAVSGTEAVVSHWDARLSEVSKSLQHTGN